MLRRIVSDLIPNIARQRVIVLCTSSVLILTVSLVACVSPTSIAEPDSIPEQILLSDTNPEPAPEPVQTTILEPAPTLTPTTFQITDLEIDPAEVNPGESFLVTANLTNTGDFEDTYTVELRVNNTAKLVTEVTMPAGETAVLRVFGHEEVPGTYILDLNGVTEQFVVRELAATLILSSPDPGTAVILSSPDPGTTVPDQDTSSGCGGCGGGSSGSSQGGCSGCGSSSSSQSSGSSSSQGGCGCGG